MVYQQHCALLVPCPAIPVGDECSHLRSVVLVTGVGGGARVDDEQPCFDLFGGCSKGFPDLGKLVAVPWVPQRPAPGQVSEVQAIPNPIGSSPRQDLGHTGQTPMHLICLIFP